MSIFKKIFSDPNARAIKQLQNIAEQVNSLEPEFEKKTDSGLRDLTAQWKETFIGKDDPIEIEANFNHILPSAFAAVREAAKRTIGQRHFTVQIMGAATLHQGNIAEMKTGEGKTLSSTMPAYLNALSGKGVHIVTVNDYLARRDCSWMGQIFSFLGLRVACLQQLGNAFAFDSEARKTPEKEGEHETDETQAFKVDVNFLRQCSRVEAYRADITYGMNSEFGFDYLRDNMAYELAGKVQKGHHYAIIDEVDSILIDEARTPLIISAPNKKSAEAYQRFARLVPILKKDEHYTLDEERRAASLTDSGIAQMERLLGVSNIYTEDVTLAFHLEQALKAHSLYEKDKDYVVKEGEIIIVDQFTGRLMPGRRYSQGLHQAIEAKEEVQVKEESRTLATITIQNYFRLYEKLAGMTGTAATEAEEFHKIYKLHVVQIPTDKPIARVDSGDIIYKTEQGKFNAIVKEIKERHKKGQPILVGTISIAKNEMLSNELNKAGVPHNLLNAKNHEREAEIIAQAGRIGAVTIATNMAGRGVDIILGGNPHTEEEARSVRGAGGLFVIGSERHEARRIDNQLRGRSGRQGDSGESQFFISLEDDLMRVFGSERVKGLMDRLGLPDDMPIQNKVISHSIEKAQEKVEGYNFDIRKHLVEYDDVINKQRATIYKRRNEILELSSKNEPLSPVILTMIQQEICRILEAHTVFDGEKNAAAGNELKAQIVSIPLPIQDSDLSLPYSAAREDGIAALMEIAQKAYERLSAGLPENLRASIEKTLLLRVIDNLWIDHLDIIEYLRAGIGLRGYGQRDPLVEYKREAFAMYRSLLSEIDKQITHNIYKMFAAYGAQMQGGSALAALSQAPQEGGSVKKDRVSFGSSDLQNAPQNSMLRAGEDPYKGAREEGARSDSYQASDRNPQTGKKIGRNDPCWCRSGKKFKKCHLEK